MNIYFLVYLYLGIFSVSVIAYICRYSFYRISSYTRFLTSNIEDGFYEYLKDKVTRISFLIMFFIVPCYYFPVLWVFVCIYSFFYLDGSEKLKSRPSKFVRSWKIWKWLCKRFNSEIQCKSEIDKEKSYIFVCHPHGLLPIGLVTTMLSPNCGIEEITNNRIHLLNSTINFLVPFYRDLLLSGNCCEARRTTAKRLLDNQKSIAIVLGGAREALYIDNSEDNLKHINTIVINKKHVGFIKLALQTGNSIVPVFTFGENSLFNVKPMKELPLSYQRFNFFMIKYFGFCLPLFNNIIPIKKKILTVFGEPINVIKKENFNDEDIYRIFDLYKSKVKELFDKYKKEYNSEVEEVLEIIE